MKPTQEQVIAWAREAGDAEGLSEFFFHPVIERFAALAYEAGRKDENEACAKIADAYEPRCDSCPSGVVNAIRARNEQ